MKRAWLIPLALAACSSEPEDSLPDASELFDAQVADAGTPEDAGETTDAGEIDGCLPSMPPTTLYQDYCEIGRLEMCLYDELRGPR